MKVQTLSKNKNDDEEEDGDFNFEVDGGDQVLPGEDDLMDADMENGKKDRKRADKNATYSYSGKITNKKGNKADRLNKTISSNRESEKKENKASKSFRDFRKKARQTTNSNYYDHYEAPPDEQRSPKFKPKRVFKEPEIQFVYKGENGDIATAKVVTSSSGNEAVRPSSGMDLPVSIPTSWLNVIRLICSSSDLSLSWILF